MKAPTRSSRNPRCPNGPEAAAYGNMLAVSLQSVDSSLDEHWTSDDVSLSGYPCGPGGAAYGNVQEVSLKSVMAAGLDRHRMSVQFRRHRRGSCLNGVGPMRSDTVQQDSLVSQWTIAGM